MTQSEYRQRLAKSLARLPEKRRREIDEDIAGHFAEGLADGVGEEKLCEMLGDPQTLAKEYTMQTTLDAAQEKPSVGNVFRVICAAIGMGMLNLILAVPIIASVFAVWLSAAVSAVAFLVSGVAAILCALLYNIPGFARLVYVENVVGTLFAGLAIISLGGLAWIFSMWFGRKLARGLVKYAKANADVVIGRRREI